MTPANSRSLPAAAALILAVLACATPFEARCAEAPMPFKLGTFARQGPPFAGLVLRDTQVIDIAQANAAWEQRNPSAPKMSAPAAMKQIIEDYESGWRQRLAAIARAEGTASSAPAYSYALRTLRILPPVAPTVALNADANYADHLQGIYDRFAAAGTPLPEPAAPKSIPGIWDRKPGDTRKKNPGMFLKALSVITGANDPIQVPRGRPLVDWECELTVVIGKTTRLVPVEQALDHVFGYTIELDVSDRDLRGVAEGGDMLIMKNHDTFGPVGPLIVPKEFLPQPLHARQVFTLNGTVMQDSNTSKMTHTVEELLHYASNILTLRPGDIIAAGSPAGTNLERAKPHWMKSGDTAVCTIEGIGTQTHAVVDEPVRSAK